MTPWKIAGLQGLVVASVLASWQLATTIQPQWGFFLGTPFGFAHELSEGVGSGQLVRHSMVTLSEATIGFLLGTTLGATFGLILGRFDLLYRVSRPFIIGLGALPVFALGPVLIFWLGTGPASKIALSFLATFLVALSQTQQGMKEVESKLVGIALAFGASSRDLFRYVIVPACLVWVFSASRLNIGIALLAAVVGEFVSARAGLGYYIVVAEGLFNIDQIWTGVFCLVLCALLLHAAVTPLERWISKWRLN